MQLHEAITPTLDGTPRFEKPLLGYTIEFLGLSLTPASPAAARALRSILAVLLVALTVAIGRRRMGARAGWLAGAVLATSLALPLAARTDGTQLLATSLAWLGWAVLAGARLESQRPRHFTSPTVHSRWRSWWPDRYPRCGRSSRSSWAAARSRASGSIARRASCWSSASRCRGMARWSSVTECRSPWRCRLSPTAEAAAFPGTHIPPGGWAFWWWASTRGAPCSRSPRCTGGPPEPARPRWRRVNSSSLSQWLWRRCCSRQRFPARRAARTTRRGAARGEPARRRVRQWNARGPGDRTGGLARRGRRHRRRNPARDRVASSGRRRFGVATTGGLHAGERVGSGAGFVPGKEPCIARVVRGPGGAGHAARAGARAPRARRLRERRPGRGRDERRHDAGDTAAARSSRLRRRSASGSDVTSPFQRDSRRR